MIADNSQYTCIVGLWGEEVVKTLMEAGSTVVAIKNAQVSDYAGKSLNCNPTHTGKIFVDPHIEKTKDLLHWYVNLDDDSRNEFKSLSRGVTLESLPPNNDVYDSKFLNNTVKPSKSNIDDYMVCKNEVGGTMSSQKTVDNLA